VPDYTVTFIPVPGDARSVRFLWVKRVDDYTRHSTSVVLDLTRMTAFDDLEGRMIDAGVDVVTISRRLGHASPAITLKIYAHLFRKDDGRAAAAINAALSAKPPA
jgi:integrase